MSEPLDESPIRHRTRFGATRGHAAGADTDAERFTSAIGLAHLVVGAIGVVYAGVGLLTAAAISPSYLIPVVARLIPELLSCYAGLLIGDGRRRGAILGIAGGVLRCVLLVATGSFGTTFVLTVALIGGAVWIMPTLTSSERSRARA